MPEPSWSAKVAAWSNGQPRTVEVEHADRAARGARRRPRRPAGVGRVRTHRKRWVKRQPGAFRGAIRVADGEIDGLHPRWRRGYGRWVRDILVWTKGPFLFRNDLVVADDLQEHRPAVPGEVKRLGDHPTVIRVRAGRAAVEAAAHGHDAELLVGPSRELLGSTVVAASVRTDPNERP